MATAPNPWNVNVTTVTRVTFVTNPFVVMDATKQQVSVPNLENAGADQAGKVQIVTNVFHIGIASMVIVMNHLNANVTQATQAKIVMNQPVHL